MASFSPDQLMADRLMQMRLKLLQMKMTSANNNAGWYLFETYFSPSTNSLSPKKQTLTGKRLEEPNSFIVIVTKKNKKSTTLMMRRRGGVGMGMGLHL